MAEMVVPLARFLHPVGQRTPRFHGHPDAVFGKLMQVRHGREKHTPTEWLALLENLKNEPVTYDRLTSRV
jgi:hypothetical protein